MSKNLLTSYDAHQLFYRFEY